MVSERQVPFPSWGTLSAGRRRKVGTENCFHPIFLYPCMIKLLTSSILVQLGAGYPITWGLKIALKAQRKISQQGYITLAALGFPVPAVWRWTDRAGTKILCSQPLPYIFLRADKALPRSERQHTNFPHEKDFFPRQLSEKLKVTF